MGAVRMRVQAADKNSTKIHQLISCELKSCVFVRNKSIINQLTYLFRTVLSYKRCLICAYFSPDSDEMTFYLEKAIFQIEDSWFMNSLKLKMLKNTRHSLMDWSHDDYLCIIVMFLSAVWTLILLAPIHCRGSTGIFIYIYIYIYTVPCERIHTPSFFTINLLCCCLMLTALN